MLLVLNKAVVHFIARYEPESLVILPTQRRRRQHPTLEKRIEDAWARRTAAAGPDTLWDGELCRLVAHGVLPDRLALFLGKTTFKEFVGTNLDSASLHEALGDDCFANPLGVSAAVVTRDGAVLLAKRSQAVAEEQGHWDLPGGSVPAVGANACDPFGAMRSELKEELGIERSDIEDLCCVSLVENGHTHKPDLVFVCRIRERARGLLKRMRKISNREHDDFMCVPATKGDLLELMRERSDELTPTAAGGLAVFVS